MVHELNEKEKRHVGPGRCRLRTERGRDLSIYESAHHPCGCDMETTQSENLYESILLCAAEGRESARKERKSSPRHALAYAEASRSGDNINTHAKSPVYERHRLVVV
jgi:hypothetical protein